MTDSNEYWQNPEDTQLGNGKESWPKYQAVLHFVFYHGYILLLDPMAICDFVVQQMPAVLVRITKLE